MHDSQPEEGGIDREAFLSVLELADGDTGFLVELLTQYLGDAERLVERLAGAAGAGDASDLEKAGHVLKASSAHVGALRLSRLSEQLQRRGREERLEGCGALATEVQREFHRVRRTLEAELEKVEA